MEKKKSPHPEWALKHKTKGTELRNIKGKYYLYKIHSKWDKEKKRSVKVTDGILGSITEKDGFIESNVAKLRKQQLKVSKIQVKEYGIAHLIEHRFGESVKRLQEFFPEKWEKIVMAAYARLVYTSPLKNMSFYYAHSYLSEMYPNLDMSGKSMGELLRDIGMDRSSVVRYFQSFNHPKDCILFDGTDILSKSEYLEMPKLSKSKAGTFEMLINMMCVFSLKHEIPIYYRLLPGNIKDISSFKLCMIESGIEDATLIIDKGFASASNIKALEDENLKFIIPLQRNSSLIDYGKILSGDKKEYDGYFRFENRFVWHYSYEVENGKKITVFMDEELRNREGKDYLSRIESNPTEYTIAKYHEKSHAFGTIAMIDNTNKNANTIYGDYKTRVQVECMIDTLKNVIDADRTYMQDQQALEGWMFINHIALQWYYCILKILKSKKLNKKYAPTDLLMMFSEIKKVKINEIWHNAEITKKTTELLQKVAIEPIT